MDRNISSDLGGGVPMDTEGWGGAGGGVAGSALAVISSSHIDSQSLSFLPAWLPPPTAGPFPAIVAAGGQDWVSPPHACRIV